MAELTTLEEKLAEVTGLAGAAQEATKKVESLLVSAAERRHDEQPSPSRIRLMRPTPQGKAQSDQVACQERPPW